MTALRAVVPYGFSVIDHNRVGRHRCVGGFNGHVTREQAIYAHGVLHRHARHIKGSLYNRVILCADR